LPPSTRAIARLERALDARGLAAQLDEKARAIITAAARHSTAHPPADFIDGLGRCIAAGSSLDEQLAKIAESDPEALDAIDAPVEVLESVPEAVAKSATTTTPAPVIFSPALMAYIMAQPSPDYWQPPAPITVGICRYCGQARTAAGETFTTKAEANDWATRLCDCDGGQRYASLYTARAKIERLFASSSPTVRELLVEAGELVQYGTIKAATIPLDELTKCKISLSAKGFLIITRTDTSTQQETV
jgi:hypothetical protein